MVGIKDMKVPKSCSKCNFKYYDEGEDVLCCALEDGYIPDDEADDKRLECCPLAETEERNEGHWMDIATKIKCSQCGTEFNDDIINMNTDVGYPRFCPFCGSKMEVEE
jgi:DNA-directed RNA polymerase subunit RPC12/RpoP